MIYITVTALQLATSNRPEAIVCNQGSYSRDQNNHQWTIDSAINEILRATEFKFGHHKVISLNLIVR